MVVPDHESLNCWAAGLRYAQDEAGNERLIDSFGLDLVTEEDRVRLEGSVDVLQIDDSCDVLEVGFGCGYSSNRIQQGKPRSHTIIECSEVVLQRLRLWAADKPNVRIVAGSWQKTLPTLGRFDCIFYDAGGSRFQSSAEMEQFCPNSDYKDEYKGVMEDSRSTVTDAFSGICKRWHLTGANARISFGDGTEFQQWASGLFFSQDRDGKEQLLDVDGGQVMMEWEKPYMEQCVEVLGVTRDSDVLEVGFGCGYSAEAIQRAGPPRTHTIIECSEEVLTRLRPWAKKHPGVIVVEGTWQMRLPSLGRFDRVFFDDYGMPGLAEREMAHCPKVEYREEYDEIMNLEAGTHFEAFVHMALKWHTTDTARISGFILSPLSAEFEEAAVSYTKMHVDVPEYCNYFFSDEAVIPLFEKSPQEAAEADDNSSLLLPMKSPEASLNFDLHCDLSSVSSTRVGSRSRSRSRSRSPHLLAHSRDSMQLVA